MARQVRFRASKATLRGPREGVWAGLPGPVLAQQDAEVPPPWGEPWRREAPPEVRRKRRSRRSKQGARRSTASQTSIDRRTSIGKWAQLGKRVQFGKNSCARSLGDPRGGAQAQRVSAPGGRFQVLQPRAFGVRSLIDRSARCASAVRVLKRAPQPPDSLHQRPRR